MTSLKYSPESESNPENNFSKINDNFFIRELLKRLDKYPDDEDISLEDSIPILYELNIFQQLNSIPDAKKRLTQDSKPNNRLQLQARFIYNLWKLISQEFIPMRYFKQIVTLFITEETSNLACKLEESFQNEGSSIIQILAIWEGMLQNKSHNSSYQQFRDSSVLTQQGGNFNVSRDSHKYSKKSMTKQDHLNYYTNGTDRNKSDSNWREKQNQRDSASKMNKSQTQRYAVKTRRQNIEEARDQIYNSNLYQIPVLTVEKEKELINRLYVVNKYDRYQQIKKIQDEEKLQKQLEQCTFRPNIEKDKKKRPQTANKNRSSRTQSKPIPGFEKAIQRMKIGQQKTKQLKQKLELRNINIKQGKQQNAKVLVPPKFLTRQNKKQQKKILFTIQFDIGRHKLTCKIHENESAQYLAKNIQSIYSLKQQSYEQIKGIIEQQIDRYFQINKSHLDGTDNDHIYNDEPQQQESQQKQNSHNFIFC